MLAARLWEMNGRNIALHKLIGKDAQVLINEGISIDLFIYIPYNRDNLFKKAVII